MCKPQAIDLYCGLGGWTDGLLAEGYDVIGFDIEQHVYGDERYQGHLVVQDVLTLHGSQFKDATLIVGSSPCQEYSYMAMPWSLAKAKAAAIRSDETGEALRRLNALFEAQFRIQREASEAAGRHIPMVVENVRGAQPWVGRAAWNYGSYYLWGDVPALMPSARVMKNGTGGSWFGLNPDGSPGALNNARDGQKNPGFRFDGSGRSFQSESVARHVDGVKNPGRSLNRGAAKFNDRIANFPPEVAEGRKHSGDWFRDPNCPTRQGGMTKKKPVNRDGVKQPGISGERQNGKGSAWFQDGASSASSASPARKAASAKIAKIPLALSRHIARVYANG